MQEIKYPYFNKDRILKIEMLENMRDFPRNSLDIYTDDLSDGLVSGFKPTVDKDIITFSKGITKYNGKIYLMPTPISISYSETDVEVVIKIKFYEEVDDKDFKCQYLEIEIDDETSLYENEQELGRFKLKKGAYLRSNYKDLYDFNTEYNTINIINVKYAGVDKHTMSKEMFKYFAKEALATRTQNQMDISFCMLCLNSQRVERDIINNYIAYRLKSQLVDYSNVEIHSKLVKVLANIKSENKGLARGMSSGQKIIVD